MRYDETPGVGLSRPPKPVTLKPVVLANVDEAEEASATAARFSEWRVIAAGKNAWEEIHRVQTFQRWVAIAKALWVGREHALRVTGANAPMGRLYSAAFSKWCKQHGFAEMQKSVRSVALELHANIEAITAWRDALPEAQRRRLVHPLSVTRRWRQRERASADIARYLHTFVNASRKISPDVADVSAEDLEAAAAWIAACQAKLKRRPQRNAA